MSTYGYKGRPALKHARRETTVVVDVERVERVGTSRNGNPTYALVTTRGQTYRTSTDSSCAYCATNLVWRGSRTGTRGITLVLSRAGRVVDFYRVMDGKQVRP